MANNNDKKFGFDTLSYLLNPIKYENDKKCMHELGLVGGSNINVGLIKGDLMDLESDLRGQTRKLGKCDSCRWNPEEKQIKIISNENNKERIINTDLKELRKCQFIKYKSVPLPLGLIKPKCPLPPRINK